MMTNFQMLRQLLKDYHPEQRGIASIDEIACIKDTLHIIEMDILQLSNLRDFVVLYLSKSDNMEDWDRMSAITSVIDNEIFKKGREIQ